MRKGTSGSPQLEPGVTNPARVGHLMVYERQHFPRKGDAMSKKGRKRKSRAKSGANHGKRPNA